jgi:hypothetical protein
VAWRFSVLAAIAHPFILADASSFAVIVRIGDTILTFVCFRSRASVTGVSAKPAIYATVIASPPSIADTLLVLNRCCIVISHGMIRAGIALMGSRSETGEVTFRIANSIVFSTVRAVPSYVTLAFTVVVSVCVDYACMALSLSYSVTGVGFIADVSSANWIASGIYPAVITSPLRLTDTST